MAIVLTAAISVPNVQRAVLLRPPQLFDNSSMMTFEVRSAAGSLASATSADQIEAAYRTGSTKALALKAVEQKCIDLGVVTLVGTVQ
jgi:hypothetical protein